MDCSIDMLSFDELLIIFKKLDTKALKNAALVCKTWYDIISNTNSFMKKYKISSNKFKTYDEITNFKRTVYDLYVHGNGMKMFPQVCFWHGSQVKYLHIYNYEFSNPKEFHDVLEAMPLLEELTLEIIKFIEYSESSVQPVALKCLKKLEVSASSLAGFNFKFLLGSQPQALRLINEDGNLNEMQFLNEFLETLVELESVIVCGSSAISKFFQMVAIKCKLKKLSVDWYRISGQEHNNDIHINNFMGSQSSLEELSLRYASKKVIESVLVAPQCLKVLKMISCEHPTEKYFYEFLKPLSRLKELYVDEPFRSEIAAKGTLRNCPMLETLELQCWEIIPMTIRSFIPAFGTELRFMFLKNFSVTGGDIGSSALFLKNNVTIEKIGLSYINSSENLPIFIDIILNMPNLRHVELNGHVHTLKAIYDGFSAFEHSQPKMLVLSFDERKLGCLKVQFKFPRDAGQWDTKCAFIKTLVKRSDDVASSSSTVRVLRRRS